MTCREFSDFMGDYLAGELPDGPRRVFEEHLRECGDCARYLESYRRTVELGRAAFEDGDARVGPRVPPALLQAVLEARRRGSS